MNNSQGSTVISLMAGKFGAITTRDGEGDRLVMMGKVKEGGGSLTIGGVNEGRAAVTLVGGRHGGSVRVMSSEPGSPVIVLRADDQGAGRVSIWDRNMKGQELTPHP